MNELTLTENQQYSHNQLKQLLYIINQYPNMSISMNKSEEVFLITSYQQFNNHWATIYNQLRNKIIKIVFYNKEQGEAEAFSQIRNQTLCLKNFIKLQKITIKEPIFQNIDYTNCQFLFHIKLLEIQDYKIINRIINKSNIRGLVFKKSMLQGVQFYYKTIVQLILLDIDVNTYLIQFFIYQVSKLTCLEELELKVKICTDEQVNIIQQVLYKIPIIIHILQVEIQSKNQAVNMQQIISIIFECKMQKLTNLLISFKFPSNYQVQYITNYTFFLMQQIIQSNQNLSCYRLKINDQEIFIPINFKQIQRYIYQLEQINYSQFIQSITFNLTEDGNNNHYAVVRRQIINLVDNYMFYEYMTKNRGNSIIMKWLLSFLHNKQSFMQDKIYNKLIYQLQFKAYYQRKIQQTQSLTDKSVIMYNLYAYEENLNQYNIRMRHLPQKREISMVSVPTFPFDQNFLQSIILYLKKISKTSMINIQSFNSQFFFTKKSNFYSQQECLQSIIQ